MLPLRWKCCRVCDNSQFICEVNVCETALSKLISTFGQPLILKKLGRENDHKYNNRENGKVTCNGGPDRGYK